MGRRRRGNTYDLIDWTGAELKGGEVDDFSGSKLQITIMGKRLRLEAIVRGSLRADFSAGILEWRVNP